MNTKKQELAPGNQPQDRQQRRAEQFLEMTNLASDWYWETDVRGRFTFFSSVVGQLPGVASEALLGKTHAELASDPHQPSLKECIEKIARREAFRDIRYAVTGATGGTTCMVSISGEPMFDDGVFAGYRGVGRDVTEHAALVDKLAQLAAENTALIENSLDMIALFDGEGRFLRVNEAITEIVGYRPEEVLGRRYLEFVVAEDREKVASAKANSDNNTVRDTEIRWLRRDGSIVHLSWAVRWSDDRRLAYATARDITERYRAHAVLQQSNDRFTATLESIGDAFFSVDRNWRVVYANRKTAEFVGRTQDALIGKLIDEAVPEVLTSSVFPYYQNAMATGEQTFFDAYYEPARAWVEVRVYPHEEGLSVFFHDITERRLAEQAVRRSEQRLQEIIEMTPAGYLLADVHGTILGVNPALCSLSGYTKEELAGQRIASLFPACSCSDVLSMPGSVNRLHGEELVLQRKDGELVYLLVNANTQHDAEGTPLFLTAFLTDISERKQAYAKLEELATHDTLTGLPNRALLHGRLQEMLESAPRNESNAVMFIDLDRFKEVNDSMGHEAGDVLLCEVARRLKSVMRPGDIVARLGGDEFVVIAHCSNGTDSAARIAGKLLLSLAAPIDIVGQEVFVGASIGISMYPQDGKTKELLFQNADTAMYRAKNAGRNCYRFFTEEMSVEAKTRLTLENALRRALERKEFELHFQPRIVLRTGEVTGMEALIRWNHPQLGRIPPARFIPIAEEIGLIDAIGRWVLNEACMQARQLIDRFERPLRVSVNLSTHQLRCPSLPEQVVAALRRARLPAHLLELELTESALIEDMDVSAATLRALRKMGILLSIDDFGTGYSGLAYLRHFPIDFLKLDRSFVTQEVDGVNTRQYLKAVVDLAHALNLSVVAEGVETPETARLLQEVACDEAQGFLYAQPLPFDEFADFLQLSSRPPGSECYSLRQAVS